MLKNEVGCQLKFKKQPDASLKLHTLHNAGQRYPLLVIEVASAHEDLHSLLCESAAWLNEHADVVYVLAAKIWPYEKQDRVALMLLGRDLELKPSIEMVRKKGRHSRYCVKDDLDDEAKLHSEALPQRYRLKLVQLEIFEDVPEEETYLDMDSVKMLSKSSYPLATSKETACKVPLKSVLFDFYIDYKDRLTKR
jgi:hypothetical protein